MKKYLVGSAVTAGVLAAGLIAGYWHFAGLMPKREAAGQALAERAGEARDRKGAALIEASDELASLSDALVPDAPVEAAVDAEVPVFELLRIEADGSGVIVGRGAPDAEIVLRDGEDVIARDRAGPTGDFVMTLDAPLALGDHALTLEATGPGGDMAASLETAIVSIPARDRPEELLVVVEAPDSPTRLVTLPAASAQDEDAVSPDYAALASASLPPIDAAPADEPSSMLVETRHSAAEAPAEDVASLGEEAPAPLTEGAQAVSPPEPASLSIAAVEIEGDRLFIAGRAAPEAAVRLYLDGAFVSETAGRSEEEFVAEALADVPVGSHVVRADELGPDGSVVARVEVPFERPEGTSMAALAPRASGEPGVSESGAEVSAVERRETRTVPVAEEEEAAPVHMQAALEPVDGRVIIRRGDTLWHISRDTYGRGSRYTVIYLANGDQIRDPHLIYPGQVFRLPEEEGNGGATAAN